jgi:xanthine/uracil permease
MSSSSTITIVIVLAVLFFIVARQFQEQTLSPRNLLLAPIVFTIYTYTTVTDLFKQPLASMQILVGLMVIGAICGSALGWYRGGLTRMRYDQQSGKTLVKARPLNIILYLIVLLARIAVATMENLKFAHTSVLLALVAAFLATFFIFNIYLEKLHLYLRSGQNPGSPMGGRASFSD